MWGLVALSAAQFGLWAYSVIEGAKQAEESAKAQKEDIGLQGESIALNKQARALKEEMAKNKVMADLRHSQAKMLVRKSVSGVSSSSSHDAMETGMEASAAGGLAIEKELAGISDLQSGLQEERLDVAAGMISSPSDLDVMLNIAGAGISAGATVYAGAGNRKEKNFTTDYSEPMTSYDLGAFYED